MQRHFLIKFIFTILLFSCSTTEPGILNDYINDNFEKVLNSPQSNTFDGTLVYGAFCNLNDFVKADSMFSAPRRIKVIGAWKVEVPLDTITFSYHSIHSFPYDSFSSMELLRFGIYFSHKYNCKKDLVNKLMRESLRKDTNNVLSLYQTLVLCGSELEVGEAIFLEKKLLSLSFPPNILNKIDRKIKAKVGDDWKSKSVTSMEYVINRNEYVYEVLPNFYEEFSL